MKTILKAVASELGVTSPCKSVDDALAQFHKAVANLRAVEQRHRNEMSQHAAVIEDATAAHAAASDEASRAGSIAAKFAALLSA